MAAHGPNRLTLAAVAAEAGLAPATLLQRFGSKRGLLLAVAHDAARNAQLRFGAARAEAPDPLGALLAAFGGLIAGTTRDEMANHIAFLGLDVGDPEFRAPAAAQATVLREETALLLGEAITAGQLRSGTDVHALARAVYVTFNGALVAWALEGDGPAEEALTTDIEALLAPYRTEIAQ